MSDWFRVTDYNRSGALLDVADYCPDCARQFAEDVLVSKRTSFGRRDVRKGPPSPGGDCTGCGKEVAAA